MKNYLLLIFAVLLLIPVSGIAQDDVCGKIIISADDFPTSNIGYTNPSDGSADQLVKNVADFFTGGNPGTFLIASSDQAYQSSFQATLTGEGHTVVVDPTPGDNSDYNFDNYHAVFLGGHYHSVTQVQDYIDGGGGVYCVCGAKGDFPNGVAEAAHLDLLFNKYGFKFENWLGIPNGYMISGFSHYLFEEEPGHVNDYISELYTNNPNEVLFTIAGHPNAQIIHSQYYPPHQKTYNWFGLFEGDCFGTEEEDLVLWYDATNTLNFYPEPIPPESFFDVWFDLTSIPEDAEMTDPNRQPIWRLDGINNTGPGTGYPGVEFTPDYTHYGFSDILVAPYDPEITTDVTDRWVPDDISKAYYLNF